MEYINQINIKLKDKFGLDVGLSNPRYRIINATNVTEMRKGVFADFDDNGNFIREVEEVREVLKYPFHQGLWILESLQGNDTNPELMARISYEPLWVFGANNSDPTPVWDKVEIIVHSHIFCRAKNVKSPSDLKAEELRRYLKEKQVFKDILANDSPLIAGQLRDGEAIVVPNNYEKVN